MIKRFMDARSDSASSLSKDKIVAALDIGTSKVCCLIAKVTDDGEMQVVGIGHHASQGLKSGNIVDLKAAENAIGQAVLAAERMAASHLKNQPLQSITVNVPGTHTLSHHVSVDVKIQGHSVTEKDIRAAMAQGRGVEVAGQDHLIHNIPSEFKLDRTTGIHDPIGMNGEMLNARLSLITALTPALNNINTVVGKNHLDIEHYCAAPFASGLSTLVDDEKDLGCTVIDMGGGTTNIGVFVGGKIIFSSAVPAGGQHVTNDIARGLTTSVTDAERIKILYGAATTSLSDDNKMIDVPFVGETDKTHTHQVPRSLLTGIIQPRIEEIFELVRARLEDSGLQQIAGRRVVLTGGASQLPKLDEIGQLILDKKIRLGRPQPVKGLAEATSGPGFSTVTGLLNYAAFHAEEKKSSATQQIFSALPGDLVQKVTQWLKENW